jgi:hypothetical protein
MKNSSEIKVTVEKMTNGKFVVCAHCGGVIPDVEVTCDSWEEASKVLDELESRVEEAESKAFHLLMQVWGAQHRLFRKEES